MLLFLRAQTKAHPTTTNIGWRFHCRKNSFLLLHPFSLDWQFVEGRKEPDLNKIWNGSNNDFLWIIKRDAFVLLIDDFVWLETCQYIRRFLYAEDQSKEELLKETATFKLYKLLNFITWKLKDYLNYKLFWFIQSGSSV